MCKHYSIEEVFDFCGDWLNPEYSRMHYKEKRQRKEFDGFMVKPFSARYQVFYNKGIKCPDCGRKGAYFTLDADSNNGKNSLIRHFNLYSEDGVLMTKDHIIPKSKGGKNILSNYQPMCTICNAKKKDRIK